MDSNAFVSQIIAPFCFQLYRPKTVSAFLKLGLNHKLLAFEWMLEPILNNFISYYDA